MNFKGKLGPQCGLEVETPEETLLHKAFPGKIKNDEQRQQATTVSAEPNPLNPWTEILSNSLDATC